MAFHESWVEKQIREAQERGDFDNLPGAGQPLRGLDDPDPDWWVKKMMAREGLDPSDALPPVMLLRREHASFPESLLDVRTEDDVREVLRDYNSRVIEDRRRPALGRSSPSGHRPSTSRTWSAGGTGSAPSSRPPTLNPRPRSHLCRRNPAGHGGDGGVGSGADGIPNGFSDALR